MSTETKPPGAQAKSKKPQGATRHGDKENDTTTEEADRTENRNTAERGEGQEREGAGDGQMKRWRKETVKEKSHGGRPAANQRVNRGGTRWRKPQPTCNRRMREPGRRRERTDRGRGH